MALYNFEVDIQGWSVADAPATVVLSQTTTQHFGDTGTGSLQVAITPPVDDGAGGAAGATGEAGASTEGGASGEGGAPAVARAPAAGGDDGAGGAPGAEEVNYLVRINDPPLSPGQTITLHIFVPEDPGVLWVQQVIQSKADYSGWDATPIPFTRGMWTTFTHTVPLSTVPPIRSVTVQIGVSTTFAGSVFLDEISW
jgi:hypothetical protein